MSRTFENIWSMGDDWHRAQTMLDECDHVFVYGTLKRQHGNNRLLNTATFKQECKTVDLFALGGKGIPYAFPEDVIPEEYRDRLSFPVIGELYEIDDPITAMDLDNLEGYPMFYNRRIISVDCGRDAWIYTIEDFGWANNLEACNFIDGAWRWN